LVIGGYLDRNFLGASLGLEKGGGAPGEGGDASPTYPSGWRPALLLTTFSRPIRQLTDARPYFPVPVSATACGLLLALSFTFSVEERAPMTVGLKTTLIVQVVLDGRLEPHVVDDTA
jgi:hypothetical protein